MNMAGVDERKKEPAVAKELRYLRHVSGVDLERIGAEKEAIQESIAKTERFISESMWEFAAPLAASASRLTGAADCLARSGFLVAECSRGLEAAEQAAGLVHSAAVAVRLQAESMRRTRLQREIVRQVLNMPQLLRRCIERELFSEVFSLVSFCRSLRKYFTREERLRAALDEVKRVENFYVSDLIKKLASGISLSQCIKIMACLRQVLPLSEDQFKLVFLQSRQVFLEARLNEVCEKKALAYVSAVSGVMQTHAVAVLTQYGAVFNKGRTAASFGGRSNAHLCSWARNAVAGFTERVRGALGRAPRDPAGATDSAHAQLIGEFSHVSFCAASLLRAGLRCHSPLGGLLRSSLLDLLRGRLEAEGCLLRAALVEPRLSQPLPTPCLFPKDLPLPPASEALRHLPPLDAFYNLYAALHNHYSLLPMPEMACDLADSVQASLESAAAALQSAAAAPQGDAVRELYVRAFAFNLLPNVVAMLAKSVNNAETYLRYKGYRRVDLMEYRRFLRDEADAHPFPARHEYRTLFPHLKARNILEKLRGALAQDLLQQLELSLTLCSFQLG